MSGRNGAAGAFELSWDGFQPYFTVQDLGGLLGPRLDHPRAAADICTSIGQLTSAEDLSPLLQRAASVLDAWSCRMDGRGRELCSLRRFGCTPRMSSALVRSTVRRSMRPLRPGDRTLAGRVG